ncbi:MAG: TrmH family RNA methyltransferase [Parachlamydiaceae bacterium]
MIEITSLQNPRIKQALQLWERKEREKTKLFLIEGYRELSRAVQGTQQIKWLFFCRDFFLGENEDQLIQQISQSGADIFSCSKQVFQKLSYRDRPDGLLAVAIQQHLSLNIFANQLGKNPFIIVAEAIEKPGNLGTILRSADASGVDGVIVCDRCTDIHNPNVVRSSVGTLFTVPVIESKSEETITWLKSKNISIVAATPHAKKEYTEVDLGGPVAIVVGTEQIGLTKKWMNQSDIQVRIPMHGIADSLNVATATTLLLYEVLRQRK